MTRVESSDGVRLEGRRCALEIRRLRPGAALVVITGDDAGELGAAPHEELDREIARYGPLALLVDARGITGVGPSVAEAWMAFIRRRKGAVRSVTLLVASRQVALSAQAAAALAGGARDFSVTSDAAAFDGDVARTSGPAPRPPAVAVTRETVPGGVVLSGGGLRATIARLDDAVHVALAGFDGGQLCAALFDAIAAALERAAKWEIFLDASGCTGVAGRAADGWAAWVGAHRERLAALHVLATTPAVRLALGLEGEMAGMRGLLRVHTDGKDFARAVAARRRA